MNIAKKAAASIMLLLSGIGRLYAVEDVSLGAKMGLNLGLDFGLPYQKGASAASGLPTSGLLSQFYHSNAQESSLLLGEAILYATIGLAKHFALVPEASIGFGHSIYGDVYQDTGVGDETKLIGKATMRWNDFAFNLLAKVRFGGFYLALGPGVLVSIGHRYSGEAADIFNQEKKRSVDAVLTLETGGDIPVGPGYLQIAWRFSGNIGMLARSSMEFLANSRGEDFENITSLLNRPLSLLKTGLFIGYAYKFGD